MRKNVTTRSGVRTHADIRPLDLKSNAQPIGHPGVSLCSPYKPYYTVPLRAAAPFFFSSRSSSCPPAGACFFCRRNSLLLSAGRGRPGKCSRASGAFRRRRRRASRLLGRASGPGTLLWFRGAGAGNKHPRNPGFRRLRLGAVQTPPREWRLVCFIPGGINQGVSCTGNSRVRGAHLALSLWAAFPSSCTHGQEYCSNVVAFISPCESAVRFARPAGQDTASRAVGPPSLFLTHPCT